MQRRESRQGGEAAGGVRELGQRLMNTMIAALRLSLTGIITTFVALALLRGAISLLTWFTARSEDEGSVSRPATDDLATVSSTHDEEVAAIMATLTAMGAVGTKQGGRIRIEKISG
ncbi:MAG: OadG family protein [Limnochordia bacterium]